MSGPRPGPGRDPGPEGREGPDGAPEEQGVPGELAAVAVVVGDGGDEEDGLGEGGSGEVRTTMPALLAAG